MLRAGGDDAAGIKIRQVRIAVPRRAKLDETNAAAAAEKKEKKKKRRKKKRGGGGIADKSCNLALFCGPRCEEREKNESDLHGE